MIPAFVQARADGAIQHSFIEAGPNQAEVYWSKPDGRGPWPLLLMLHPHQSWPDRIGAEVFVKNGSIAHWTNAGFVTAAVSFPGYGKTPGPADFCGPESQQVAWSAIKYFESQPFVSKGGTLLYGGSRGAVVASMLAARDLRLAGVVLKSGLYDLLSAFESYPWYDPIKLTMRWEMGWITEEKLKSRSALYAAAQIKAPLLVIHGSNDDRAPVAQAESFTNAVKASGGKAELLILPSEHVIPMEKIFNIMHRFFDQLPGLVSHHP